MRLLGKNKENSIENLSNGPGTEVGTRMFTNKYLIRLLWPLFVEQLLVFAIGIADSFMVASVGEEAVSAVSLVDSIMMLLLLVMNCLNRKEVAMFDNLHLTNMLRSEVESVPETGLPLDAFPDKIQEIILNLARYENFNVEYTVSIILSAVATAVGNSCHIRIKGEWKTCP